LRTFRSDLGGAGFALFVVTDDKLTIPLFNGILDRLMLIQLVLVLAIE